MASKGSVFSLDNIFGKSPLKSWTAWGLVIFAVGEKFVAEAAVQGVLGTDLSSWLQSNISTIGEILAVLGVRRRL